MIYYEHYQTAHEECDCDTKLECDTLCHSIENCQKWEEKTDEVHG